ncbi:translation repressor protein [Pseudomonas phage PspYZU05]|uniref:Translation repressor protein n=1 Tax=Pseudomonas phage PspYZU05 TaxID=1983556 RepID=A0A2U7N521_9CAUD|nr:translation repressor protein [Pseudomonas phage PspYZU05]ASD52036.1 translation repressor protein [Pseudomonas phage PspYZU05]
MVEIYLNSPEDFLKVRETLTRMGIANNKDKVLYPSCNILKKQDRYYIVHFKEMLKMDGRKVNIDEEDISRLHSITRVLDAWGLVVIAENEELMEMNYNFRILSFEQKNSWTIKPKYVIGK